MIKGLSLITLLIWAAIAGLLYIYFGQSRWELATLVARIIIFLLGILCGIKLVGWIN